MTVSSAKPTVPSATSIAAMNWVRVVLLISELPVDLFVEIEAMIRELVGSHLTQTLQLDREGLVRRVGKVRSIVISFA